MRGFALGIWLVFTALVLALGSEAVAQGKPVGQIAREAATPLLDQLKAAKDEATARMLEAEIWSAWGQSGDGDIDGLMQRAASLMQVASFDDALAVLDAVVAKAPGFAEGWNRRATLLYAMNDYDRSMTDITRVLELEPRHFGALSGIALIRNSRGDKAGAVAAYKKVLEIDPMNTGAKASIEALAKELDGAPI